MSFVPADMPQKLPLMSRSEVDAMDFGITQVDDDGIIQLYNRYGSDLTNITPAEAEGRNFFTQAVPCCNNRLLYGKFKDGIIMGSLDIVMPYTFTYKLKLTNVMIHLYRDRATKTNWILVQRRNSEG